MLTRIRPHQFFPTVPDAKRLMECMIPQSTSGFRLLDLAVVVSLLRLMHLPVVWNIGSFTGETLHLLARNCPAARFRTIDLPAETVDADFVHPQDAGLHRRSLWDDRYNHPQIVKYIGDSRRFDWSQERADMVIIDGAHDLMSVGIDTWNAFDVVRDSTQPCIVWHDMGNPKYQITLFLEELALKNNIVHVEETMIAFYAPWWKNGNA